MAEFTNDLGTVEVMDEAAFDRYIAAGWVRVETVSSEKPKGRSAK
jgi:hypothetical protein